jgi:raffinose/stachyose/melibiose transport system permease protein
MNVSIGTRVPQPSRSVSSRYFITILFFLAPALLVFSIFLIYPMVQSVYFSFFKWKGFGPPTDYIALQNYFRILNDKNFLRALQNGLLIVFLSLVIQLPMALALALMVGRTLPGRAFFRIVFFLPYVLSEVITAVIWRALYHPDPHYGLINAIMVNLGLESVSWLAELDIVMPAIFVVLTWKYFGFHMLLYMAGLQSIPTELEDAAKIDGATGFQTIWYIIIPLLKSTIRTSVYLSVLGSLQLFGLVWTYLYRYGFIRFSLGYGSAVAVVMFIICITFSLIYQNVFKEQDYIGGYGV